ncbi:MAG: preprotein translocase subunit SecE [Proteobacteria bacterium]|nr:MAG: preprotein translocase subunit SecE [Pseudomonadota bacterium]
MDNNQQKWVNLSFVAASLLLAYVLFVLATKFSVLLDFEGRVGSLDKILLAVAFAVGIGFFIALTKSGRASNFMQEVVAEVAKVTWPATDETFKATIAVLIAVTISGVIFWLVDSVWVYLLSLVI